MPNYKAPDNSLHFLDSEEFEYLLPSGSVLISEEEVSVIQEQQNPPPTLEEIKAKRWEDIKLERGRRTLEGGYQVQGKWFHSDLISRQQQLGLNILNGSVPEGIMWKTMDGSFVEMTWPLAQQILAAAAANDIAIFDAAEMHKAAMESSADPGAYNFNNGWPAAYGEQE